LKSENICLFIYFFHIDYIVVPFLSFLSLFVLLLLKKKKKKKLREIEKREMRERERGKRIGKEEGNGGVFGGSTAAREDADADADAGWSWPVLVTPKMGFFWRFVRYPYSRKLIFFMGK
jgi:hypothetical protein